MRRRFFVERFEGSSATIRGEIAEHLGRVLRARPGQLYELSDGERVWLSRIEGVAVSKRGENRIDFTLVEPIAARQLSPEIHLLISLIKFDRFEWCLEKATELGAAEIIPLAAARTDKPLLGAAKNRRARWERILAESAQQARCLRPPGLGTVVAPRAAFLQTRAECRILLSERLGAPSLRETSLPTSPMNTIALAIGPEGGWTDEEEAVGRDAGFMEASLGENILRTETAVIAALALLCFLAGNR